jgi:PAS domain S-box-containing protein
MGSHIHDAALERGPYRQLFENAPIGIVNVSLDGVPLMVNERAASSFGYDSPAQFLAEVHSMIDLWVDPAERDRAAKIMVDTGVLRDFEVEMKRRDGTPMSLLVSANPWRDDDGTVIGVQVSGLDVTARKRAEQELKDLNRMKSDFVGIVAHDLQTPLTVAGGYAAFLKESWSQMDDDERWRLVDRIQGSLDRLQGLVSSILEVARLESGTATYDVRPFDLGETVRSAVEEVCAVAAEPRCSVSVEPALPAALADSEGIWRVSANLVSNAVKYSPPDAPVTVAVGRRDGRLLVSVHDEGPGISYADQSKLFQRFSRLASGSGTDGSGLGLFICKSIVESLGGSIWVESGAGQGSTFSFTVPAA